ncbi:MAG: hypothetical protein ACLFQ8_02105 [Candidatus Aenigmatarchaeota archaeon]
MDEVESKFSRIELSRFLEELASQIRNGKVSIEIPGYSKGKAKINPKQPVSVFFEELGDERSMKIKIDLDERRDFDSD